MCVACTLGGSQTMQPCTPTSQTFCDTWALQPQTSVCSFAHSSPTWPQKLGATVHKRVYHQWTYIHVARRCFHHFNRCAWDASAMLWPATCYSFLLVSRYDEAVHEVVYIFKCGRTWSVTALLWYSSFNSGTDQTFLIQSRKLKLVKPIKENLIYRFLWCESHDCLTTDWSNLIAWYWEEVCTITTQATRRFR